MMTFSELCKKMYFRGAFDGINSQHQFVSRLFYACGADIYPEIVTREHQSFSLLRCMFSGKRNISKEHMTLIESKLDDRKFVDYFKSHLNNSFVGIISANFGLNKDTDKETLLIYICQELRAIVKGTDDIGQSSEENAELEGNYVAKGSYRNNNFISSEVGGAKRKEKKHISLWIPDAEDAEEEQAEFGNFTYTSFCQDYIGDSEADNNSIKGILSVKGAGKTYILQMKRRRLNRLTIPVQSEKLSKANEWGVESVVIDEPVRLNKADVNVIASLWKASIVCMVITCISERVFINNEIKNCHSYSDLSSGIRFLVENPEIIKNPKLYQKLSYIMNYILTKNNWTKSIGADYSILKTILLGILRQQSVETPIVVFIDKTDQAILQPEAEAPKCSNCYKDSNYSNCKTKGDEKACKQCVGCCFTCEVYSKSKRRPYGGEHGKRYEHITKWQHLQIGLVVAVSNLLHDFGNELQVFYSVRQEAFNAEDSLLGGNAKKIMRDTKVLRYTKEEQRDIFNNTIKVQPVEYLFDPKLLASGRYSEAFIGISELCHPFVQGEKETVFDSIYRHTFDRAREIQRIGEALSKRIELFKSIDNVDERAEKVKSVIEQTAAELVFNEKENNKSSINNYYGDKHILLNNYWADPYNFSYLISQIDRNLLFIDDMAIICRKINNVIKCDQKCRNTICRHHPFSMLYRLGLLGIASFSENVIRNSEQQFLDSNEITYFRDSEEIYPDDHTLFIVHPALTKCIEIKIRKGPIKHFKGFILGKGLTVPRDIHKKLLEDKQTLQKEEFEKKYYS